MKTEGVKLLVADVLNTLQPPHSAHIIDEVLCEIEEKQDWRRRYDGLCDELGQTVVNAWCGQWIANALGKCGEVQVPSRKSTLIQSYSLLDADAKAVLGKPQADEARQMMADYYHANKEQLHENIRQCREEIIALIMDGMPVHEAFAFVQDQLPKA